MGWKHWAAVVVVIGVGIVAQIPMADDAMEEHQHPSTAPAGSAGATDAAGPAAAEPTGPYRTIALEVTGMT